MRRVLHDEGERMDRAVGTVPYSSSRTLVGIFVREPALRVPVYFFSAFTWEIYEGLSFEGGWRCVCLGLGDRAVPSGFSFV